MTPSPDETTRQRELDLYRMVDSLPETAYDDIARLASTLCDAPIALVSLIDRDRQWWKAKVGIEGAGSPREHAICDHAIRQPGKLFEVGDLPADPRFADNPFVTGDVNARFYAGMPLVTPGGQAIGTVCVIDHAPRTLSEPQRLALESLARLAMNLMEAAKRERDHRRAADLEPAARAVHDGQPYSIAILQVQDFAGAVERLGDRAVEKTLHRLDALLDEAMRPGDSVSRVTGTGESVALLHGEVDMALEKLRLGAQVFAEATGLPVLVGSARAESPDESPEAVYLRADAALGAEKDRLRQSRSAA